MDLDSWLPKTVYCGIDTLAYKGPQLWQQVPAKIKNSNSLVSFKHNIKHNINAQSSMQNIHRRIGIHINKTRRDNLLYYYCHLLLFILFFCRYKLVLVIIFLSTLNKFNK